MHQIYIYHFFPQVGGRGGDLNSNSLELTSFLKVITDFSLKTNYFGPLGKYLI